MNATPNVGTELTEFEKAIAHAYNLMRPGAKRRIYGMNLSCQDVRDLAEELRDGEMRNYYRRKLQDAYCYNEWELIKGVLENFIGRI